MYHEVYRLKDKDRLSRLTNPIYNIELNYFQKQMDFLFKNRFKTLTIHEYISEKSYSKEKVICLTFDDGWLGNYLYAYPILKKYDFKATFFIATDLIGKPLYMTWEEIEELASSGMSIQSHTVTHQPLAHLGVERVLFELSESKKVIEERVGQKVEHLSLPHGIKDERIWALAQGMGYKSICTSEIGYQRLNNSGPWLKRIVIGDKISLEQFYRIAQGQNQALWGMAITKTLKDMFRGVIGIRNYRRLYQRIYAKKVKDQLE